MWRNCEENVKKSIWWNFLRHFRDAKCTFTSLYPSTDIWYVILCESQVQHSRFLLWCAWHRTSTWPRRARARCGPDCATAQEKHRTNKQSTHKEQDILEEKHRNNEHRKLKEWRNEMISESQLVWTDEALKDVIEILVRALCKHIFQPQR